MTTSFTVIEVAARLHIHADSVRDLIRSGELPAFDASVKPNSLKPRYRITADALAGFEARRSVHVPQKQTRARKPAHTFKRFV